MSEVTALWGRCRQNLRLPELLTVYSCNDFSLLAALRGGRAEKMPKDRKGPEIYVEVPSVFDRIEVRPDKSHLLTGEKDK